MKESLLQKHYSGLHIRSTSLYYEGFSDLWLIELDDGGKLLLKEMPERFSLAAAEREAFISRQLSDDGVPTAKFQKTRTGSYAFQEHSKTYHLQQYIPGVTYRPNECPPDVVNSLGYWLGRIHRSLPKLGDEEFESHLGGDWVRHYNVEEKVRRFAEMRERIRLSGVHIREMLVADVDFRIQALHELDLASYRSTDWSELTYGPTHGDFHCLQVLVDDDQIAAIIDFTSACIMPHVWEIARAFTQSDISAASGEIRYERLKAYLRAYVEVCELTPADIRHFFDLYYLQLLGSTFGYRQAAAGTIPKNELWDLGRFAMWRTSVCRWLSVHRADLTEQLIKDFPC